MKKIFYFLLVAVIAGSLVFLGCNEDGVDGYNGNSAIKEIVAIDVLNSNSNIATVEAILYWENPPHAGNDVIAFCSFQSNGFKLKLPDKLEDKYIWEVAVDFGDWVSNKNAQYAVLNDFYAFNNANNIIGFFYHGGKKEDTRVEVFYMYADRNCTIKGKKIYEQYNEELEWNCSFKKGWNVVYEVETYKNDKYTHTTTTTKPFGITLNWCFYEGYKNAENGIRGINLLNKKY